MEVYASTKNGSRVISITDRQVITLADCTEIAKKFDGLNYFKIFLPMGKELVYNAAGNCLRIWVNGLPIYENDNGLICNDGYALADSLL